MAGPLSNLPLGLNDLVGLRGQVAYPNNLTQELHGSIDIVPLLLATYGEVLTDSINAAAVGSTTYAVLTVPQGEIWLCESFSVSTVTIGAAEVLRVRACVLYAAGALGTAVMTDAIPSASSLTDAAGVGGVLSGMRGPFYLGPGAQPAVWVEKITTAGTIAIQGRIRFMRLRR